MHNFTGQKIWVRIMSSLTKATFEEYNFFKLQMHNANGSLYI